MRLARTGRSRCTRDADAAAAGARTRSRTACAPARCERQDPGAPLVHEAVDTELPDRRVVRVHPAGPDGRRPARRPHGLPGRPGRQRALRRHHVHQRRRPAGRRHRGPPDGRESAPVLSDLCTFAADPADPPRRRRSGRQHPSSRRRLGRGAAICADSALRERRALASGRATARARPCSACGLLLLAGCSGAIGDEDGRAFVDAVRTTVPSASVLPRRPAALDGRAGLRRGRPRRGGARPCARTAA